MQKRTLGKTGLEVTVLGYGAMGLCGSRRPIFGPVTDDQAEGILNAVLDAEINYIDTSFDYGMSEEYIGRFASHRRDEYYLATKCGCHVVDKGDQDEVSHVWTRENLMHNIEVSLKRLRTDHVDVWQYHGDHSPEKIQAEDLMRVMADVQKQGKVRFLGASTGLPHVITYADWKVFDVFQLPYSALHRKEENSITYAAKLDAGTVIRGGVNRGEPQGELSIRKYWPLWEQAKLDDLRAGGENRTAFMLRFTIRHPHVNTTIVGTMNPVHLAENVKSLEAGPLPDDVYAEAKRRLDQIGQEPEQFQSNDFSATCPRQ